MKSRKEVLDNYWEEKKAYQNNSFEERTIKNSHLLYLLVPQDAKTVLDLGAGRGENCILLQISKSFVRNFLL